MGLFTQPSILLAEDDEQVRELLKLILHEAGFRPLVACNGEEAMELARRAEGIDLLVSNVQMPGVTGPDLAKQLREIHPNPRILLISAYPEGILALDNGWHFFKKPFPPAALIEKIQRVLSNPPMRDTDQG